MRLLLDTHAFLWFAEGNSKLSQRARLAIEDQSAPRFLSIASLWEIAIKLGLGRLRLSISIAELARQAKLQGIELLPVSIVSLSRLTELPQHHKDPFDRLLAATCLAEDFNVISADTILDAYGVSRVW